MSNNGKFRTRRHKFTQVSNTALMDQELSLKAKGLYALINSFITIPDFVLYKQTVVNACKEGRDGFNAAWNELKNKGYLIQYKINDANGKFIYEYELMDEPQKNDDTTTYGKAVDGDNKTTIDGISTPGETNCGKATPIINTNKNNIIEEDNKYKAIADEKLSSVDKSLLESFDNEHKTINKYYNVEEIVISWLRIAEAYQSVDLAIKCEGIINNALNKIKLKNKLNECVLNKMFDVVLKHLLLGSDSSVLNIETYLIGMVKKEGA